MSAAIRLEIGIHNSTLPIVIALAVLDESALPTAMYPVSM